MMDSGERMLTKSVLYLPSTRAEKLRGVPSPMPELSKTPQANQMAELKLSASSSVPSLFVNLYLPNGENLCVADRQQ